MGPHQKAEECDGQARTGDEAVAKNIFAREARNDLADDPHRGQDHDVNHGMGVEPKQVLKQQGVASQGGVEYADAHDSLDAHQHQSRHQDRRRQQIDEAVGISRPDE